MQRCGMEAAMHKTERTAQEIVRTPLPHLDSIYDSRVHTRACLICADPTHPGHKLFLPLPSGKRYRNIITHTKRQKHIFFPRAVRLHLLTHTPIQRLSLNLSLSLHPHLNSKVQCSFTSFNFLAFSIYFVYITKSCWKIISAWPLQW